MDIKLLVIGNLDKPFLQTGCQLYLERIKMYSKIDVIEIKELVNQPVNVLKQNQTKLMIEKLAKSYPDYYKVLLDINGQQIASEQLSAMISEIQTYRQGKLVFIIGPSHGFTDEIHSKVHKIISFGAITLPHQLCRLILLEQVYRAFTIINNEKYHK
ncbi:23S rRNA (pseudouridine(1915)-N(3))-methyltransferase RlmH [Spiroplasma chrysopicola]|uniref:Ribosomal RNA large subunit methyltransferase H n=1 Tax=Spiroplasma chrysopicola DF-1 TaxID=1276227 RepID=R4U0J6_9MOLU|nr:23S rRNA (pseudouridine(1915)-N(3))-methyltransferase RlmH [Spiroplasma chrysopicola]AGM24777.1 rRNA large subunit methyltransferase [Spiroplasma chrysopicola DF-1]